MKIQTLTLFTDAKATKGRFGITADDGTPLWHGRFFDNDSDFTGEQSTGELSVARKAIWLAGKVRQKLGLESLALALSVDATWLCTLSGKAAVLLADAERYQIALTMRSVIGKSNPADPLTVGTGFHAWDAAEAAAFVVELDVEEWEEQNSEWQQAYDAERDKVRRVRTPVVTPEITAERQAEAQVGDLIGELCRKIMPEAHGKPAPGTVSQRAFKRALRAAHAEGRELNEATAAAVFAELSAEVAQ